MLKISSDSLNVEMEVPHEEKLVNVDINLKEGTVQLYYEGWGSQLSLEETPDSMTVRYDGELDDPDHPVRVMDAGGQELYDKTNGSPRRVKDNPQA